jgi:hypothetical protein
VLALDAVGDRARAAELFAMPSSTCGIRGGAYWTGWQFVNQAHYPAEQSSWTAATIILAADALSGTTGGAGIFRDAAVKGWSAAGPVDGTACGCGQPGQAPGPGPASAGNAGRASADTGPGPLEHP